MKGTGILAAAAVSPLLAQVMSGVARSDDAIKPFKVDIDARAIHDLKARLAATRWPTKESVDDWSQGIPLAKAKSLIDYWAHDYDMGRVQRQLNSSPQYRTQIDGLGIHFLHVPSKHPDALPILFTHGWPGSPVVHAGDPPGESAGVRSRNGILCTLGLIRTESRRLSSPFDCKPDVCRKNEGFQDKHSEVFGTGFPEPRHVSKLVLKSMFD